MFFCPMTSLDIVWVDLDTATQRALRLHLFLRSPSDYELSGSNLSTLLNSVVEDETNDLHKD